MTVRASVALLAALALSALACTKTSSTKPGIRFRQPSSVAVFRGRTLANSTATRPYLVVANQSRNDLSIVDAVTDAGVPAPIKLYTLTLPVEGRPALVAAASLGDYEVPGDERTPKPDLLVAVSSGGSVLQLVETWNTANLVHPDGPLAVELGYDILALAPVPSAPGTARIAAVLADSRVAVVTYVRGADGLSIAPVLPPAVGDPLPFQPLAIAAMPGPAPSDPATALYVATRDPIGTDSAGKPLYGVEEISLPDLLPVRALGARGPTRLVAAARLRERKHGIDPANQDPGSAANDQNAFDLTQPEVRRVYAVLDESGCGLAKPIDCGVVALDPNAASGTTAIPDDDQFMPYRAPMRVPGRPLAIAVSGPPAAPPPNLASDNIDFNTSARGFMRLYSEGVARATTAVAAVASDDGRVYFLDLGRFEGATTLLAVSSKFVEHTPPGYTRPCGSTTCGKRLRLVAGPGSPPDVPYAEGTSGVSGVPAAVTVTPGFTPDQVWTVEYQGLLSYPDLYQRAGEAGPYATDTAWVALQVGVGGGRFNEVVRIWDPRLGVRAGDNLVIKAGGIGGACVGTPPVVTTTDSDSEFEVGIVALAEPTAAYPGGAAVIQPAPGSDAATTGAWRACYDALVGQVATSVKPRLVVSVRAGGYVVSGVALTPGTIAIAGSLLVNTGYVGRPVASGSTQRFTLKYENEDALACPFDAWNGTPPAPACDATCRDTCEKLAIGRKVRRYLGLSVTCSSTTDAARTACLDAWQGNASTTPPPPIPQTVPPTVMTPVFPLVYSPVALDFTFAVQPQTDQVVDTTPARGMTLAIKTSSAPRFFTSGKSSSPYQANGITTFDRSLWAVDPVVGYRYLVSYPADFVLDTSPSLTDANPFVIR